MSILIKKERLRLTKNALFKLKMQKTALFQYSSNPYSQSVTATLCKPPFGMLIKERAYSSDSYRFGFNGMEKVDEVSGEANNLDFGARIYDSRLGRFFSADPRGAEHFWHSSYSFAANSPIYYIDNNGEIPIPAAVFGAITGALSEALGQVGVFVLDKGMSLPDAFANVNMNDVFIAAGTGAITGFFDGGTSKFIKFVKSKRTQKLMKISALFILEIVEDVTKKICKWKRSRYYGFDCRSICRSRAGRINA